MPAPDVLQDEIECTQGQSSIGSTNRNTRRRQEECRLPSRSITAPFSFQVIGQRIPGISREKDSTLGFALAFHTGNFGLARRIALLRRPSSRQYSIRESHTSLGRTNGNAGNHVYFTVGTARRMQKEDELAPQSMPAGREAC